LAEGDLPLLLRALEARCAHFTDLWNAKYDRPADFSDEGREMSVAGGILGPWEQRDCEETSD
jgi:hypothetical protein